MHRSQTDREGNPGRGLAVEMATCRWMAGDVPGYAIEHLAEFTATGQSHSRFYRFDLQMSCRLVQPRALAAASNPALAAGYDSVSLAGLVGSTNGLPLG
jgi:hypothetical protein